MTYFFKMLDIQMILLVYLILGLLCRRLKMITKENQGQFISFILNIIMPCMVFQSFKNVTFPILQQAVVALMVSLVICLFALILGRLLYQSYPTDKQRVLKYATLINNAGFAGLPLAQTIYGDEGLIYASVFLIPIRVFMWSAGITMLSAEKIKPKQLLLRLAMNVNIIAVMLGILRGLLQMPLPSFLDTGLSSLSSCVSPLSMIVIGAIISDIELKGLIDKAILSYSFVRLIAIPLVILFTSKLLHLNPTIIGVSVTLSAMPAATSTSLLAIQNGLDGRFASKLILMTTLASLFTAPIVMAIVQLIL